LADRVARNWDSAYVGAPAPWDIGRPQPIVEAIADSGGFHGRVLDVGCGSGENALYLASRGFEVVGVDWSGRAISIATSKAAERSSSAQFVVGDATALGAAVSGTFESAVDSGCFHTFDDAGRPRYVRSVADVLEPGATLHLLCFSEHEPGDWGPRRVKQAEIRDAFAEGWQVRGIEPFRFATRPGPDGAHAWHATIERV
jgi:SAM-dependent methyltransferase